MDPITIGQTITALRHRDGMTQAMLADKLHISSKTVSKWENGLGYPEVTQFPALADIFGVTVDYLMTGQRKGIMIAGNIITDLVKTVECYPEIGMLAGITGVQRAVGGCAANTSIDLARIDKRLPLSVFGRIGDDENGRFILSQLNRYGIDSSHMVISADLPTSFCDVMSLPSGERTFFHARGANVAFSPADIPPAALLGAILHIGYILLLDMFDAPDAEYGTVMARFLHDVQARGVRTSIDVVSNSTADYKAKILPALKYCDYCIVNEIESSRLSDLSPYTPDGRPHIKNIRTTMEQMAAHGITGKVIVHCKQAGFCLDVKSGSFSAVPSLAVPQHEIRGSVGAGDAFCAGCLYGIYHAYEDTYMLEFASAVAASSLFAENSTDGVLSKEELETMLKEYGRQSI